MIILIPSAKSLLAYCICLFVFNEREREGEKILVDSCVQIEINVRGLHVRFFFSL
jgi:hypothetical protein